MKITTYNNCDNHIVAATNDYYALRWYYSLTHGKLMKYSIDSLFKEETGYMNIFYDEKYKPINIYAVAEEETQLRVVVDTKLKYEGEKIIYYLDIDGNWYDRELMGDFFPYDDPFILQKNLEKALIDIETTGTTHSHFIKEPDYSRYE